MATEARINAKTGIPEHKHDGTGWHWASAGHRDDGTMHKEAGADKPKFVEGTTDEGQKEYFLYFKREKVAKIPSKAKPKAEEPATTEKPAASAPAASNGTPARQPAAAR